MDQQKTGALIAGERKRLGLTQRQLAENLNISDRTVSKWERGSGFPDVSLLEPLSSALGLTPLDLLRGERAAEVTPEEAVRETLETLETCRRTRERDRTALVLKGLFLAVLLALLPAGGAGSLRSLVLGLLAWGIPVAAASNRLGRHVGGRFPVWSMACCGGALLSELLVVRSRCLRGDWPGVADTIGAVCLAGTVLLAVSAALNVLALALRALDKE